MIELTLIIAALFLLILIYMFFAFDWPTHFLSTTTDTSMPASTESKSRTPDKDRHEYKHRENEKIYWIFSTTLSISTTAIAVIGSIFAGLAYLAARDQAATARMTLVETQRPFVYVKDRFPAFRFQILNYTTPLYIYNPEWVVAGTTQPVSLKVSTVCQPVYIGTKETFSIDFDFTYYNRSVGPGQQFSGSSCFLPLSYVDLLREGKIFIAVVDKAMYFDIFGARHVTEKCDRVEGLFDEPPAKSLPPNVKPNLTASGSPCETLNCVDAECEAH